MRIINNIISLFYKYLQESMNYFFLLVYIIEAREVKRINKINYYNALINYHVFGHEMILTYLLKTQFYFLTCKIVINIFIKGAIML